MKIITKTEAIVNNKNRYFDGTPCRNGHISEKYVRDNYCCECKIISEERNKARRSLQAKARYAKASEKIKTKVKSYVRANREAVAERQALWRERNKEVIRQYRRDNSGIYAFHAAKRRKKVRDATPPWADMDKIKSFYLEAQRLTESTGIPHEVDHIIPISHPLVCGLHHHTNLQVITKEENNRKSNTFEL